MMNGHNGRRLNGTFAPGVSGSPGGRPKLTEEQRAALEVMRTELTEKAVAVMRKVMDGFLSQGVLDAGGDMQAQLSAMAMDARLAMEAAKQVLNRSLGKPESTADLAAEPTLDEKVAGMSKTELAAQFEAAAAQLRREAERENGQH